MNENFKYKDYVVGYLTIGNMITYIVECKDIIQAEYRVSTMPHGSSYFNSSLGVSQNGGAFMYPRKYFFLTKGQIKQIEDMPEFTWHEPDPSISPNSKMTPVSDTSKV